MRTISKKKIKAIGASLGVKLTVDETLDKYSRITVEKFTESNTLLSNSSVNF